MEQNVLTPFVCTQSTLTMQSDSDNGYPMEQNVHTPFVCTQSTLKMQSDSDNGYPWQWPDQ